MKSAVLTSAVGNVLAASCPHAPPRASPNKKTLNIKSQLKWFGDGELSGHKTEGRNARQKLPTPSPPPLPYRRRILASNGATSVRCKIPPGHHHLCPYLCTHYMLMEWAQLLLMNTIYFNKERAHVCGWWSECTCQTWKASSASRTFDSIALFPFLRTQPCVSAAKRSFNKHPKTRPMPNIAF